MRCCDGDQDNFDYMGASRRRAPLIGVASRYSTNLLLNGWPGEVERDSLPLDRAEDNSGGLLGHDLKEFDLEH